MEEEKLIKDEAKRKKEETKKWGAKISIILDWGRENLWLPFQQLQIEEEKTFDQHSDKLQIEVEKPLDRR